MYHLDEIGEVIAAVKYDPVDFGVEEYACIRVEIPEATRYSEKSLTLMPFS